MTGDFLNELRNNPKLRWGVALIIGIAWLYGILLLRDTLQEQEQQYRAAAQSIPRLRAQLAQPEWEARVIPAKSMALQLEGQLWQAPTPGLGQAALKDWLTGATTQAGIIRPQIDVTVLDEAAVNATGQQEETGATSPPNLLKVTAKLGFDFSAPALLNLLNQIESHDKKIIVAALNARKEPAPRIEIELHAYFQKQASTAAESNRAKPKNELVPL